MEPGYSSPKNRPAFTRPKGRNQGCVSLSAHLQNKLATPRSNPIKLKKYAAGGLILSDHGLSKHRFSRFCAIFHDGCRCWQNFGSSRRSKIALASVVQFELAGKRDGADAARMCCQRLLR